MKISRWLLLSFVVASYILAFVLYNNMPDPMVSHWNAQGVPDGYVSRFGGMLHLPFAITGFTLFFLIIPKIDPLKKNVEKFSSAYDWFVAFFAGFMLYVYVLTLLWNFDVRFDFVQLLIPAIAMLFFLVGILLGKAKRNYFIGIRTAWTLNNEEVWDRTHKIGSRVFKIAAILTLPGVFLPSHLAMWFMLAPILSAAIILIITSYVIHQRVAAAGD